ncbi:MAG: hypothetical protein PHR28_05070 [candidate division Zixibacteria bacterium]|nr:hypothetical protein [candidate division Zixibacteria bacterium]
MMTRLLIGAVLLMAVQNLWSAEPLTRDREGLFAGNRMEQTAALKGGQKITINGASSLSGTISVTTGGRECRVAYRKLLKAPDRQEAADYADLIQVETTGTPDGLLIDLQAPTKAPWSGGTNAARLEVEITVPEKCAIKIATAYFDITAIGPFAEFVVTESLSKVRVEKVDGVTEIKVSNRPLAVKAITGKLSLVNKYSDISLEDIDTGDETGLIINDNGEVDINKYRGGLDLRTSYDRIVGRKMFLTGVRNRVKNVSGSVALSFDSLTTGKLRITDDYGQVTLDIMGRVDARFVCRQAEKSKVTVDHMTMEPTAIYDNRLEFATGQEAAEVRVTTTGDGDILINGPDRGAGGGR